MTQPGMQQGVETPKDQKVESGGLAPAARKMLEGVFQADQFEKFGKEIVFRANLLMKGEGTEEDKRHLLETIDNELGRTVLYGDAEGYATNYFERLKAVVEGIEIAQAQKDKETLPARLKTLREGMEKAAKQP